MLIGRMFPPCAGLTSEDEDQDFLLEASQGDRISGKTSRKEVAAIAVAALGTGASVGEWRLPCVPALNARLPSALDV